MESIQFGFGYVLKASPSCHLTVQACPARACWCRTRRCHRTCHRPHSPLGNVNSDTSAKSRQLVSSSSNGSTYVHCHCYLALCARSLAKNWPLIAIQKSSSSPKRPRCTCCVSWHLRCVANSQRSQRPNVKPPISCDMSGPNRKLRQKNGLKIWGSL